MDPGQPGTPRCSNRSFPRAAQNVPPEVVRPPPNQQQASEGKRQEEEERSSPPTEEEEEEEVEAARHQEETREFYGISLPPVEPRRRTEDASPEAPGGRGSRSDPIPLRLP